MPVIEASLEETLAELRTREEALQTELSKAQAELRATSALAGRTNDAKDIEARQKVASRVELIEGRLRDVRLANSDAQSEKQARESAARKAKAAQKWQEVVKIVKGRSDDAKGLEQALKDAARCYLSMMAKNEKLRVLVPEGGGFEHKIAGMDAAEIVKMIDTQLKKLGVVGANFRNSMSPHLDQNLGSFSDEMAKLDAYILRQEPE